MTRKCSVLQCWTGKDSTRPLCHGRRISFHRFPLRDPKMLRRWEVAVKRPKTGSGRGVWPGPTIHSSVCSLHFKESDFETESQDKNVTRRLRKQDGGSLLRVKLTKSAVPSIFFEDQSEWAEAVKVSRKHSLGQAPSLEEAINMGKFDHVSKKKMAQTKEQIRLRKEQAALDMINTCIIAGCNNDACNLAGGVAFFQSVSLAAGVGVNRRINSLSFSPSCRFPKEESKRRRFMLMCGRDPRLQPPSLARLCSVHFDPTASLEQRGHRGFGGIAAHVSHEWDFAMNRVRIVCSPTLRRTSFWRSVRDYYRSGLFCDVDLVCKGHEGVEGTVSCHRLVLASMSSLKEAFQTPDNEPTVVYLLDLSIEDVKKAISALYNFLADEMSPEDFLIAADGAGVFSSLGVDVREFGKPLATALPLISNVHVKMDLDPLAAQASVELNDENPVANGWREYVKVLNKDTRRKKDVTRMRNKKVAGSQYFREMDALKPLEMPNVVNMVTQGMDPTPTGPSLPTVPEIDTSIVDKAVQFRKHLELCHNEKDLMHAELQGEAPVNPTNHTNAHKRRTCQVMAIAAVKKTNEPGNKTLLARPLVWSPQPESVPDEKRLTPEMVQKYLRDFTLSAQKVFGMSQAECYYQPTIFHRTGAANEARNGKLRYNLERTYRTYDDDALKALLTEEVVEANRRTESKQYFAEGLVRQGWAKKIRLRLTGEAEMQDPEGLLLLTFENNGFITARGFKVEETTRKDDLYKMFTAFFDVLLVGVKPSLEKMRKNGGQRRDFLPRVEDNYEKYFKVQKSAVVHQVNLCT